MDKPYIEDDRNYNIYEDTVARALERLERDAGDYANDWEYISNLADTMPDEDLNYRLRNAANIVYPTFSDSDDWHPEAAALYHGFLVGCEISSYLSDEIEARLVAYVIADDMVHHTTPEALERSAREQQTRLEELLEDVVGIRAYEGDEVLTDVFLLGVVFIMSSYVKAKEFHRAKNVGYNPLKSYRRRGLQKLSSAERPVDLFPDMFPDTSSESE